MQQQSGPCYPRICFYILIRYTLHLDAFSSNIVTSTSAPTHPGVVLREWIPKGMTVTEAAKCLGVARVTLSKLLNGSAGISAEMALRLSRWLGTPPDVWLRIQAQYDLWEADQRGGDAKKIIPIIPTPPSEFKRLLLDPKSPSELPVPDRGSLDRRTPEAI